MRLVAGCDSQRDYGRRNLTQPPDHAHSFCAAVAVFGLLLFEKRKGSRRRIWTCSRSCGNAAVLRARATLQFLAGLFACATAKNNWIRLNAPAKVKAEAEAEAEAHSSGGCHNAAAANNTTITTTVNAQATAAPRTRNSLKRQSATPFWSKILAAFGPKKAKIKKKAENKKTGQKIAKFVA